MVRLSRKLDKIILSQEQIDSMRDFCVAQDDVLALYLYGSYGTKYQSALSDVDLAVLPMPETCLNMERLLQLEAGLAQIGETDDINLINLRRVPVTLQMRVLEAQHPLFTSDEILVADFLETVIRRYCDFEPDFRAIQRDYDAGLREEFLDGG